MDDRRRLFVWLLLAEDQVIRDYFHVLKLAFLLRVISKGLLLVFYKLEFGLWLFRIIALAPLLLSLGAPALFVLCILLLPLATQAGEFYLFQRKDLIFGLV